MAFLPGDFFVAADVEIGLVDFDGFEPGAVLLDEVEHDGCHLVVVRVRVRGRLDVGEVADVVLDGLRVVYSNPKRNNCISRSRIQIQIFAEQEGRSSHQICVYRQKYSSKAHIPGLKSLSVCQGLLVAARRPLLCGVSHYRAKIYFLNINCYR